MKFFIIFVALILTLYIKYSWLSGLLLIAIFAYFIYKKKKLNELIIGIILAMILLLINLGLSSIVFPSKGFGIIVESKENYFLLQRGLFKVYIYFKNNPFEVGDIIYFSGSSSKINFETIESVFNFNEYLNNKMVYYQLELNTYKVLFKNPIKIKKYSEWILNSLSIEGNNLMKMLIFNQQEELFTPYIDKLSFSFLFHASSIHIYFLFSFISSFTKPFVDKKTRSRICNVVLGISFALSSFKSSILRLIIFQIIGKYLSKSNIKDKKEAISLAAIILLIINPNSFNQSFFYYSIYLSFFIAHLQVILKQYKKSMRNLLFFVFIQLFLIPYQVYQNFSINLLSPFLILFFGPILSLIYVLGFFQLMIPIFAPIINFFAYYSLEYLKVISNSSLIVDIGQVTFFFYLLYYLFLVLFLYHLEIKNKNIAVLHLIFITLLCSIQSLNIINQYTTEIIFINVGQGDSVLIKHHGINVLIDTGGKKNIDITNDCLIPFFKKEKVKKLDALILSHDDLDHSGGKSGLLLNFPISQVVEHSDYYQLDIKSLHFTNLNPYPRYEDENSNSSVLYINIKGSSFLFMGDAPEIVEKKIINNYPDLTSEYLKIGHHGSKTSSSNGFIKAIQPRVAIISCGASNYYGHPHNQVLATLNKYGVKILRTDILGTIRIRL